MHLNQFPQYLKEYPNRNSPMPLHISINRLDHGFPPHRHDFLELEYVIEGRGTEFLNGVAHPMLPGTLTFILPYQIHEIRTEPGQTLVLYNCMFSMDLLIDSRIELDTLLSNKDNLPASTRLKDQDYEHFLQLLQDMYKEYLGHDIWRTAMLKARLTEVLVRYDRARRTNIQHRFTQNRHRSNKPSLTWRILHYIHNHYQEELSLEVLANHFNISKSRVCERIKEMTDQTFTEFLNDLRLRHACSLLESTELSVSEIAYEVGFGSYKTFVRQFRAQKKISPTNYRKAKKSVQRDQH